MRAKTALNMEKNCTDECFYFLGKIMLQCVESRASYIAVHEMVHLIKFIGKGCSLFFSSAYVTLLRTTG